MPARLLQGNRVFAPLPSAPTPSRARARIRLFARQLRHFDQVDALDRGTVRDDARRIASKCPVGNEK